MASDTFSGSSGSNGGGFLEVFTEQNRHPLVHVSPMIIIVAVAVWSSPPPQHSPILGHRASSLYVEKNRNKSDRKFSEEAQQIKDSDGSPKPETKLRGLTIPSQVPNPERFFATGGSCRNRLFELLATLALEEFWHCLELPFVGQ